MKNSVPIIAAILFALGLAPALLKPDKITPRVAASSTDTQNGFRYEIPDFERISYFGMHLILERIQNQHLPKIKDWEDISKEAGNKMIFYDLNGDDRADIVLNDYARLPGVI